MLRVFILASILISCNNENKFDEQKERKAILELQQQQRENHFRKNAANMVSGSSDSFYVIDAGSIHRPKREEQVKSFTDYFNSVEFVKWDDKKEPLIRFSNDGSMAYAAIEKLVVLKIKEANGREVLDTTHFAWMSVYRNENGKWIMDAIAPTNK